MKRIQLFEFEDFSWFPNWLRNCMTNLIVVLQRMMGTSEALASLIARIIHDKKIWRIVDMGSGSGGAMPEVLKILHTKEGLEHVELMMTDLYPNKEFIQRFNNTPKTGISYYEHSVDATDIATAPEGLKTMVNSFHHMPPKEARKILESAQENHQPLLIYELGENNIPLLVWWVFLPIGLIILVVMVLFMTPFVKPLTWRQLVFTYIIPIIPICYAWDGQASLPRMYTLADLDKLLEGLKKENYIWEKGYAKTKKGKKKGTYLMGIPK
ncbi:hypothetical protein [Ulvibacterium sp.]|uniref:hypothetical protein n=1 Tax=Ulvibacterium sp. TaxID=2665914 RepID=UPI002601B3A6|nr:hypothetical protein [Ulvibacterium sp.]